MPSQGTRRIVILLDSSKSMGESNSSMKLAMQVVKDFIEGSPSTEQLALIDFSDQAYIDIPLESADSFARHFADPKTTGKIKPAGPTILFQAMANAADYLYKSSAEGDSLFVISDGLDNASRINLQQLNETLFRDNVRAYLFLLGTPVPDKVRKQLQATIDVIHSTGGLAIGVRPMGSPLLNTPVPMPPYDLGTTELEKIRNDVQTVHHLIENAYKVEFDLQPPPESKRQLQVSVLNPDGTVARDKQTFCPTSIQP